MIGLWALVIAVSVAVFLEIWEHERDNATSLYHRLTRRWRKRMAKRRGWTQ